MRSGELSHDKSEMWHWNYWFKRTRTISKNLAFIAREITSLLPSDCVLFANEFFNIYFSRVRGIAINEIYSGALCAILRSLIPVSSSVTFQMIDTYVSSYVEIYVANLYSTNSHKLQCTVGANL